MTVIRICIIFLIALLAGCNSVATHVTKSSLSFYPGYYLSRHDSVSQDGKKEGYRYFITDEIVDTTILSLNGTSLPIHDFNADTPILLLDSNVVEYLNFFCTHVHGELGAFQIVNSVDDIEWNESEPLEDIEKAKRKINGFLSTMELPVKKSDGSWTITRLVHYGHALFRAIFKVTPDGKMEMLDDKPLAAELPTKVLSAKRGFYQFKVIFKVMPEKGGDERNSKPEKDKPVKGQP